MKFRKHLKNHPIANIYWDELKDELAERIKKPWSHPQFIIYFFFVICLLGLAGIYTSFSIEMSNCAFNHKSIILSMETSFIALIASAAADMVIAVEGERAKMFKMIGLGSLLAGIGLFWLTNEIRVGWNYIPAVAGLILAMTTWWIANAKNTALTSPPLLPGNAAPPTPDILPGSPEDFLL